MTNLDRMLVIPREISLMPFWFWNDNLQENELLRQIADFDSHGVYGFVIHPRVGLPRSLGWMSDELLHLMAVAIDEARRRDMKVILYDEGMYPSGSSSGQVVAENPDFACRGLAKIDLPPNASLDLKVGETLVARIKRADGNSEIAIIDRPVDSFIRGLHYIEEGPGEDEPPMADILNPLAVQTFIRLVYDRFAADFGEHFSKTVIGIFTDEPHALGRCREQSVWPGTTGILQHINQTLGYDFTEHLPALWFDDEPDARHFRNEYHRAVQRRMEQTWYEPLSRWCRSHNIALCGHPASGDEIAAQRFFDIPGQDLVWRFIEPDKLSALEGGESTQAKSTSSSMIHLGRRRNSNEFCGAYGPQTSFAEMKWLADWCLVRGVNLLIPHAFYYSIRGLRKDERPPQLGPNSPWWDMFKPFADHCARLCWVNTDSQHICRIAILADPDHCGWSAAKVCYQHQRDFNYVDISLIDEQAMVSEDGLHLAGMHYQMVILEDSTAISEPVLARLSPLLLSGRLCRFQAGAAGAGLEVPQPVLAAAKLLSAIDKVCDSDITVSISVPSLRYRHVVKEGLDYYLFFNEESASIRVKVSFARVQVRSWIDTATGSATPCENEAELHLGPFELKLLTCWT